MEQKQEIISGNNGAQQEISGIDRARELFEYEMTEVLLNFKNEVKSMKGSAESEYLSMEVPKAGVECNIPEIAVEGIDYGEADTAVAIDSSSLRVDTNVVFDGDIPSAAIAFEQNSSEASVDAAAFEAASFDVPVVKLAENAPEVTKLSVSVDAPTVPEVNSALFTAPQSETAVSVELPEEKAAVDFIAPQIQTSADVKVPGTEQVALPAIQAVEQESVRITAVEAQKPELPGLPELNEELPSVSVPVISDVKLAPDLSAPKAALDIDVPDANASFDGIIVLPEQTAAEIEYPGIPAPQDFSAYYAQITEAIKSEQ